MSSWLSELKPLKIAKKLKQIPSRQTIKILMDSIDTSTAYGRELSLLIDLLYFTGMRIDEVAKLEKRRVNFQERRILIKGKGGHERWVYFPHPVGLKLKEYFKDHDHPFIFKGIKARTLGARVENHLKRIGFDQRGCHFLRYSIATHLYEAGANLRLIQTMLGHKKLSSTLEYIQPRVDYLKELHKRHHPAQKSFL